MKRFFLPKTRRLLKDSQFKDVLSRNLCASKGLITLYMSKNDCGYSRLGVTVSKSCGGAVVRNRLKRRFREAFRLNQHRVSSEFDYLLMVSARNAKAANSKGDEAVKRLEFEEVEKTFLSLVDVITAKIR